jgi:aminobenzoyl-glutamate utilization protein B
MDKATLYRYLDGNLSLFTDVSDKIWDYAETAFEEFKSAALLKDALKEHGFHVEENAGDIETAFTASYGTGAPKIGILAEYDALSGLSQKGASAVREEITRGGNGHGCGHNLFAGGSLAAALALKEYLAASGKSGTVTLFGCPGEEGGSGKAFMARAGVFNGLDAAFGWHPLGVNAMMDFHTLANYQVLYKFKGIASHAAAAPHKGRSALDAAELMNVGVNFLREHVIQEARIHYAITNAGGFSPNVVQPAAEVLYLIRAPQTPQVEEIYRRINKIAKGAAMMTETDVEIQFIKACANLVPNKALSRVMYDNMTALGAPDYTKDELSFADAMAKTIDGTPLDIVLKYIPSHQADAKKCADALEGKSMCGGILPFYETAQPEQMAFSTDVGDVSWLVPTAQVGTACCAICTPEHSWQLVSQGRTPLAHKGMLFAAKVMAASAVDVFENPALAEKAKAELKERLGSYTYTCAIPSSVTPKPIGKL